MIYTQNHNIDGWPICKDGEPLSKKECLADLQTTSAALLVAQERAARAEERVKELERVRLEVDEDRIYQAARKTGLRQMMYGVSATSVIKALFEFLDELDVNLAENNSEVQS